MNKYAYKPYNSTFPQLFEAEKERLKKHLSGSYQIEHIGSTSVPSLGGKGIIDIMIAVPKEQMEAFSQQAQKAGYIFRPLASTETRLFLRTEYPEDFEKEQAYHLHITFPESDDWKEALVFRDYLRTHSEDLRRYEEIKIEASKMANENTDKYKRIKEAILNEILSKALTQKNHE